MGAIDERAPAAGAATVGSAEDSRPDLPKVEIASSPSTSSSPNDDDAPPRHVTLSLLRKRSEHNECMVSTLEELALHQEELRSIGPVLGRTCGRTLKILLLQNNVIDRMHPSELKFFRVLEYLNLALNNVRRVEGVGGMEMLRKLDLTLNFVDLDELEGSVDELARCRSLEELYLLGNPCMGLDGENPTSPPPPPSSSGKEQRKQIGWAGCRAYVVARLPGLRMLDGKEIKRSERIVATQCLPALEEELRALAKARRLEKKSRDVGGSRVEGERYVSDDGPTHHDPETRTKLSDEMHEQKLAKERQQMTNAAPPIKGEKEWEEDHADAVKRAREREERGREWEEERRRMEAADTSGTKKDGGIKQCNQGKHEFWFDEEKEACGGRRVLIMSVAMPKHLSTSLVDVDVHPTYVSVVIKSKILRVLLPGEVISSDSRARRSAASGNLEIVMPKANPDEVLTIGSGSGRGRRSDLCPSSGDDRRAPIGTGAAEGGKVGSTNGRQNLGRSMLRDAVLHIVDRRHVQGDDFQRSDDCESDSDEPPPLH